MEKSEEIEQLETIIALMPGHVYWLDRNNVYLGCNDLQAKSLGLASRRDIVGKRNADLVWADQAIILDAVNLRVMETGQPLEIEEVAEMVDGMGVFLSQKVPIKNKADEVVGLLGVSFNITNHKQDELDRLDKIISLTPGNVYWLDRNNVYRGCNDNQARAGKLASRQDIIGKTNSDMIWRDQADALDAANLRVMETGEGCVFEEEAEMADGPGIYLSEKVPIRNKAGNVVGMLGISFNITERKRMEQELKTAREMAENANYAKTEFMRNMEHDIRTPLCGVAGVVVYLNSIETDPHKKELLTDAENASTELLDYLNSALEFSQLHQGETPVVISEFNLEQVIRSVFQMELPTAKNKKLIFTMDYSDTVPKIVFGDRFRIYRILINLIGNAIKFTSQGHVKIHVNLVPHSFEDNTVKIKIIIEDTGVGIAQSHQALIYDKFTRCTPANKGIYKGSGLGLWVVKQLIEEVEGTIELISEIDKGSIFSCILPFKLPLAIGGGAFDEEKTSSTVSRR